MTSYRIAEAARRTGFTTTTLRYYEDIGLVPPPDRTAAGYRTYDDDALERLAFVARAKQLGCSLDEIAELMEAWDGGRCGPVQRRLRAAVDAKVADAETRVAELVALTAELRRSMAALARHRPDGPCDDRCGCTATPGEGASQRTGEGAETAPVACTLGSAEVGSRLEAWRRALADVRHHRPVEGGVRLELGPGAPVGTIAQLAAAEQACCRFFAFALTVDERGPALEITAPPGAADVVASLFGAPPADPPGDTDAATDHEEPAPD